MPSILRPRAVTGSTIKSGPLEIVFDGDVRRRVSVRNRVASHPQERGADISDHVSPEQITIDVTGVITDTPTEQQDSNPEQARSLSALSTLLELVRSLEPISIISAGITEDQLVIEELSHEEARDKGHAAEIEMKLVRIQIVETETAVLARLRAPAKGRRPVTRLEDLTIEAQRAQVQFFNYLNTGWTPPARGGFGR